MTKGTAPRRRMREVGAQFGGTEVIATDAPIYNWRDPYHALLAMSWGPFLALVLICYVAINAVFGVLYWLWPDSIANLPPDRPDLAFFFSVETFGTVGYGVMAPRTEYAHVVATAEVFLSLVATAVLTGLIFARFARPRADVEFSRQMTMAPQDGIPTLSVRLGRHRIGTIFHVEASLTMIRRHETLEGDVTWRAHDLSLMRSRIQGLSLAWTLRHVIDETSPLRGLSVDDLIALDAQFVISMTGTDGTLAAPVHAIRGYDPGDIAWGCRFVDLMTFDTRGRTQVELARLHEVAPV